MTKGIGLGSMPEGGLAAGEDTEDEKEDEPEAVEDTELVLHTK
jgi:hypothetical protein